QGLLHNDVFAVLWAGSRRPWGVGVVCGAGMNCVGVAPDGREVRFLAVGELSGDLGGGHGVGVAGGGGAPRGGAVRRRGVAGVDVAVVCGGGLFRRDAPAFLQRIRSELATLAPAARVTRLRAPPVVGAALLGLDRLGAPPGAAGRLRATLTHERLGALEPVAASNR